MARLFISAIQKSSGKTTLSIGLAAALAARGLAVQTFKKGPDYIDPMWLSRASGRACANLDFNTQTPDEIGATFARYARGADLALIEGNKGLHDGLDLEGADSSAALAKLLGAPVAMVVDVFGMARGVAPLMQGYTAFDRDVRIAGVILNKVGAARQETKLRQALERYTDVPVIGAVGRDEGLNVVERHLGLTTPAETASGDAIIARLREVVARGVDLDRLIDVARTAAPLPRAAPAPVALAPDIHIAVARDAAFGFYYDDDFEALRQAGAELVFFDALKDGALPPADALLIGGGFPETQMAALSANAALRADIRARLAGGMPAYAECGGLMYLTRGITWRGETHEMVGAIAADTIMGERPQGRGLVVLAETANAPWPMRLETTAPAHEFHYARLENLAPATRFAWKVLRGFGVDGRNDGVVQGNVLASFAHLRDTSRHHWARRFVEFARATRVKSGFGARRAG